MIKYKYIHGDEKSLKDYDRYRKDEIFFREECDSLEFYTRQYENAIFFDESVDEIQLIKESVVDGVRTIGNKILDIIARIRKFIFDTFQNIKTNSWKNKSDERKLELLSKKNPDLAKRATIAIKDGKLKLNDFKDLSTFYRTIDEVLDEIDKNGADPKSLKAKINKAKDKFDKSAKVLATVAGIAGSALTIYKFVQLFKKHNDNNDKTLEQMRNAAEVEMDKIERTVDSLNNASSNSDFNNLKSKSSILAYAATQVEQATNSAISMRSKFKFSLLKTYDKAVHIFDKSTSTHDDVVNSVSDELIRKYTTAKNNYDRYQTKINNRRR